MAQKTNVRLRNLRTYLNKYMADLEQTTKDRITAPRTRTYPSGKTITSPIEASGNLRNNISVSTYEDSDSIGFTLGKFEPYFALITSTRAFAITA